jgi:hypothetical protein
MNFFNKHSLFANRCIFTFLQQLSQFQVEIFSMPFYGYLGNKAINAYFVFLLKTILFNLVLFSLIKLSRNCLWTSTTFLCRAMHFLSYAVCTCARKYYFRSIFHSSGPGRKKIYKILSRYNSYLGLYHF